jgi:hypothetical protein
LVLAKQREQSCPRIALISALLTEGSWLTRQTYLSPPGFHLLITFLLQMGLGKTLTVLLLIEGSIRRKQEATLTSSQSADIDDGEEEEIPVKKSLEKAKSKTRMTHGSELIQVSTLPKSTGKK